MELEQEEKQQRGGQLATLTGSERHATLAANARAGSEENHFAWTFFFWFTLTQIATFPPLEMR